MTQKIKLSIISIFLVFLIFSLILTGCSALGEAVSQEVSAPGYDEGKDYSRNDYEMDEKMMEMEEAVAAEAMPEEEYVDAGSTDYADTPYIERKIIKNAYMDLEIEKGSFEDAISRIISLAEKNNGFVSDTQSYSDAEGNLTSGSITIRIPAESFDSIVASIKDMGTIDSVQISGQDVTEEYIDLESRLRNLEAQEEILLDLMAESKKVSDTIEVQRELSYVQGEIEVIKGRMHYLDNMVAFSTIDVNIYEPIPIQSSTGWGFLDALKRGARGAVTVLKGMLTVLIVISPILVLAAIITVIIVYSVRARRRKRAAKKALKDQKENK